MALKDHLFFKIIEDASRVEKLTKAFGAGYVNKNHFFTALKKAHPFIFDKKVTHEKRMAGKDAVWFEELVTEFSLPFRTSLYLMTGGPTFKAPLHEGTTDTGLATLAGYLINEITPEKFQVFEVTLLEVGNQQIPAIYQYDLDLKTIETIVHQMKALNEMTGEGQQLDRQTRAHVLKEFNSVFHFTKCISVKRIGIEKVKNFNVKSRGIGTGFTAIKMDNLIHIADKVEYHYTTPAENAEIDWNYVGFWRGHWRAFYVKDSHGDNRKDDRGWNVVDYGKTGKDRQGDYCVSGYTWVVEHTKGHPALAAIKTRVVVNKSGGKI